jgi:hypothetical protein
MAPRKPFLLRIDPALCAELEAWAQSELRSVNGQIEYILKQAVQKRRSTGQRSGKSEANPREKDIKQGTGEPASPPASDLQAGRTGTTPEQSPPPPSDPPDEPQRKAT